MFDQIDRKIIDILQQDANKSVVDIANEVGLSHTPCWRRIKRMEDMGLIRNRVALVDRRMANVGMTIFIAIKVPRHNSVWLDAFRKEIRDIPEIVEAYRLTGETETGVLDNRQWWGREHPDWKTLPRWFREHGFDAPRDLGLDVRMLEHSLDDEVAAPEVFSLLGRRDPRQRFRHLLGRHALADALGHALGAMRLAFLGR